ncbi:alkaline phosphatase [Arenibacter sp. S6351L]|uniref:alkaline phosphatase n=1 Tax=Arenibacter sp. S6351L TaxID=2926407 RepID=UPI001FF4C3A5|nr:alkaline phosphatase [Arenibacter sp. S6351L]MCK0133701.1 alkaline phosphatase [Arenibacter sp. S6351L]
MLKSNRFFLMLFLLSLQIVLGQKTNSFKIHSHNDYLQTAPFWDAYAHGANSIEVDVFLKNGTLYATHDEVDIIPSHTMESLYLEPLKKVMELQLGKGQELQLLIDIKSETYATLAKIVTVLEKYPSIIQNPNITMVISGNRPKPEEYKNYPKFIMFDYQSLDDIPKGDAWEKVALISLPFYKFSRWNGKGRLTAEDLQRVKSTIDKAHSFNRPFRFWATPDSKSAWKALHDLGVDYINTDMADKASVYLETLGNRVYYNKAKSHVYIPTYKSDQTEKAVKNVILLIGDGNGLTQISSSVLANGGSLTLTQLKSIGFIKTQSSDDFTTDSAAAGTALATGAKTYNRSIGMASNGQALVNITELLDQHQFVTGCITTDKIVGATPSSFYAHQKDRDDTDGIAKDLLKSKLSLFVGGGESSFNTADFQGNSFSILKEVDELGASKKDKIGLFIAENDVPSFLEGRGNILAEATRNGLQFLNAKKKPFFLMVEAAQIDSYGHKNEVGGIVTEGIDFDVAIAEAIKFADKSGNTLVVITADHETSGFTMPQGNMEMSMVEGDFTTDDHTATMVPIFAYGPHSQEFQGVYENNEVFHKILKVLNIKESRK